MTDLDDQIRHFLLVYNRSRDLLDVHEFEDGEEAISAYDAVEREISESPERIDAVLVGAESLESVKVTHSTWFPGGSKSLLESLLAQ